MTSLSRREDAPGDYKPPLSFTIRRQAGITVDRHYRHNIADTDAIRAIAAHYREVVALHHILDSISLIGDDQRTGMPVGARLFMLDIAKPSS